MEQTGTDKKEHLNSFSLWLEAFAAMKANYKIFAKLGLSYFCLPLIVFVAASAYFSKPIGENITQKFNSIVDTGSAFNFNAIVAPASNFLMFYILFGAIIMLLGVAIYIALTKISLQKLTETSSKKAEIDSKKILLASLKFLFPKGLLVFIVLSIISTEQGLVASFRVFTLMASIMLIIVLQEKSPVFRAFWDALLLRYVSKKFGAFSVFLIFLTTAITVYFYERLVAAVIYLFLHLDEILCLSNVLWTYCLPGFSCTLMYLIGQVLFIGLYYLLLVFLACFSVCTYLKVRKPLSEKI